jgi:hypothetical protein
MGDAELLKASTEAVAKAAAEPFKDLIIRSFGGAADEIGEVLTLAAKSCGLPIKAYLNKQAARFEQRTNSFIGDKKIIEVPPPLLLTMIEYGVRESDDDLQDRWAALLANYATGGYKERVFPEILKRLSRDDADLLRKCLYAVLSPPPETDPPWMKNLLPTIDAWNLSKEYQGLNISYDNLLSARLLVEEAISSSSVRPKQQFSWLGYNFALACENPEKLDVFWDKLPKK